MVHPAAAEWLRVRAVSAESLLAATPLAVAGGLCLSRWLGQLVIKQCNRCDVCLHTVSKRKSEEQTPRLHTEVIGTSVRALCCPLCCFGCSGVPID